MPAEATHIDRIALPRSLVGRRRSFEFRIGQQVEFHGDRAVITGRQLTAMGNELYDITINNDERPQRTVRGQYLVPTNEDGSKASMRSDPLPQARRALLLLPPLADDLLRAA